MGIGIEISFIFFKFFFGDRYILVFFVLVYRVLEDGGGFMLIMEVE